MPEQHTDKSKRPRIYAEFRHRSHVSKKANNAVGRNAGRIRNFWILRQAKAYAVGKIEPERQRDNDVVFDRD